MSNCKFCKEEGEEPYECAKKKPVTLRIAHGDLEAIDDYLKRFPSASRSDLIGVIINYCLFNMENNTEKLDNEMKADGFKKVEE